MQSTTRERPNIDHIACPGLIRRFVASKTYSVGTYRNSAPAPNYQDDHAMLEQGVAVYDALYASCRGHQHETRHWSSAPAAP
jgi:hypothetical protein